MKLALEAEAKFQLTAWSGRRACADPDLFRLLEPRSVPALLTFRAGLFFVVGAVLRVAGCLATALAPTL